MITLAYKMVSGMSVPAERASKNNQIREALRQFDEGNLTVERFLERSRNLVGRDVNFTFEDPGSLADEVTY